MSFFSLSSSSSTPCNTPIQGVAQQESPLDAYNKWKLSLTAVPQGMALGSSTLRNISGRKSKKGKPFTIKDLDIISKTYNTVASRPLSRSLNTNQIYVANLRLDTLGVMVTSSVANIYGSQSFALNDFPNRTEYTGLFDQYKIVEFEAWFEPTQSQSTAMANTGYIVSCVDVDDSTTPTTVTTVEGKQNAITSSCYDGHYHRWQPHMAVACYSSAFTSFANSPPMWIDVGSPNVQHYGLKYASVPTTVAITFNLQLRAKILFRQAGI